MASQRAIVRYQGGGEEGDSAAAVLTEEGDSAAAVRTEESDSAAAVLTEEGDSAAAVLTEEGDPAINARLSTASQQRCPNNIHMSLG
jgi:hypothetical protein